MNIKDIMIIIIAGAIWTLGIICVILSSSGKLESLPKWLIILLTMSYLYGFILLAFVLFIFFVRGA